MRPNKAAARQATKGQEHQELKEASQPQVELELQEQANALGALVRQHGGATIHNAKKVIHPLFVNNPATGEQLLDTAALSPQLLATSVAVRGSSTYYQWKVIHYAACLHQLHKLTEEQANGLLGLQTPRGDTPLHLACGPRAYAHRGTAWQVPDFWTHDLLSIQNKKKETVYQVACDGDSFRRFDLSQLGSEELWQEDNSGCSLVLKTIKTGNLRYLMPHMTVEDIVKPIQCDPLGRGYRPQNALEGALLEMEQGYVPPYRKLAAVLPQAKAAVDHIKALLQDKEEMEKSSITSSTTPNQLQEWLELVQRCATPINAVDPEQDTVTIGVDLV